MWMWCSSKFLTCPWWIASFVLRWMDGNNPAKVAILQNGTSHKTKFLKYSYCDFKNIWASVPVGGERSIENLFVIRLLPSKNRRLYCCPEKVGLSADPVTQLSSLWFGDSHPRITKCRWVTVDEDTCVHKTAIKEEKAKVIGKAVLQLPWSPGFEYFNK